MSFLLQIQQSQPGLPPRIKQQMKEIQDYLVRDRKTVLNQKNDVDQWVFAKYTGLSSSVDEEPCVE